MATTGTKHRTPWTIALIGVALALATAYGAYSLAGYSWSQVVDYRTPYANMDVRTAADGRAPLAEVAPDATAHRVVMIVVDGLPTATAQTMSSINTLAARGANVAITTSQPSLSFPGWTNILSGAPPQISGVTTNYSDARVRVETLFDSLAAEGHTVGVVGSSDMEALYGVSEATSATVLEPWPTFDRYRTAAWVDAALAMTSAQRPDFLYLHIPDIDNIGHEYGTDSRQWRDTVAKVDADLARFIAQADDGNTTFVLLPDHGRIAAGGHGGWEPSCVDTFAVFAGPGVTPAAASAGLSADLDDIAPTVSVLAGVRAPASARGTAIEQILTADAAPALKVEVERTREFADAYAQVVGPEYEGATGSIASYSSAEAYVEAVTDERLHAERGARLPIALGLAIVALAIAVALAIGLKTPLIAVFAAALAYLTVYNGLFFGVHGYLWSLSTFNEDSMVDAFMNGRLIEASVAGLIGCVVGALVFARTSRGDETAAVAAGTTARWFGVGVASVWAMLAMLALQIAWFLWWWGAEITWVLPDFMWAFKYDLDLVQATALGAAALIGPVVTLAIGWWVLRARSRA